MDNFSYKNTTQIHFGKGQISKIKDEIPADARVLITYGGGSVIDAMAATGSEMNKGAVITKAERKIWP